MWRENDKAVVIAKWENRWQYQKRSFPQKPLLSVCRTRKCIVHYDLEDHRRTIPAEVYRQALDQVCKELCRKRPNLINRIGVILQHDNVNGHRQDL